MTILGVNSKKNYNALVVFVDVNGDTSPNALGYDIFYFIQTKQCLIAAGSNSKPSVVLYPIIITVQVKLARQLYYQQEK